MSPFHGCLVVTSDMARIAHLTAPRIELPCFLKCRQGWASDALLARGKAAANRNRHQSREELRSLSSNILVPRTQKGVSLALAS